jgi:hypothetical protein
MTPIDRAILERCVDDFHTLRPLRDHIPQGSLYRHVNSLVRLGWLQKEGTLYKTTDAGRRQLIEATSGCQWDGFVRLYAPYSSFPRPFIAPWRY